MHALGSPANIGLLPVINAIRNINTRHSLKTVPIVTPMYIAGHLPINVNVVITPPALRLAPVFMTSVHFQLLACTIV